MILFLKVGCKNDLSFFLIAVAGFEKLSFLCVFVKNFQLVRSLTCVSSNGLLSWCEYPEVIKCQIKYLLLKFYMIQDLTNLDVLYLWEPVCVYM